MSPEVELQVWQPMSGEWRWSSLPISDFLSGFRAEVEHLGFGSLSFTLPSGHAAVSDLVSPAALRGDRLITVDVDGQRFGTFIANRPSISHGDDGNSRYTLQSGLSALQFLQWVTLWPNPAQLLDSQVAVADEYPGSDLDGPAEDVIHHYLLADFKNRWAGGSTCPPLVDSSTGRGAMLRGRGRFQKLWRLAVHVAELGGLGLYMRLVDTSDGVAQLHAGCYLPTDRTDSAVFSEDLGTLRTWDYAASPRTLGRAIVGDSGKGTARAFIDRTAGSPTTWGGYAEGLVSSDSTQAAQLRQDGDAELADNAGGSTFDMTTVETEGLRYGTDYGLGDIVTVDIGHVRESAPVASVALTVDDKGVRFRPVVGDPNGTRPAFKLSDIVRASAGRISDLERT